MYIKRFLSAVVSLTMIAAIGMTGCGSSDGGNSGSSTSNDTAAKSVSTSDSDSAESKT